MKKMLETVAAERSVAIFLPASNTLTLMTKVAFWTKAQSSVLYCNYRNRAIDSRSRSEAALE